MADIGPISRRKLIASLRSLGFEGPYSGGKHEYMRRPSDRRKVTLPNPHGGEIDRGLLSRILTGAGIKEEWRNL